MLLIFILTAGLRYRLGTDTITYEREYSDFPTLSGFTTFNFETTRYGRGYLFLNAIARSISDNFVVMQILHATLINCIIFWFFYKNCKNIFLCALLYGIFAYFDYNFEIMRESCAICCFLVGWKYFVKGQWHKYYICATIAVLFHVSALIIWILPLCYLPIFRSIFRINRWFLITIIIVFVVSAIIAIKFFDLIRLVELAEAQSYADTYENSRLSESLSFNLSESIFYTFRYLLYPLFAIFLIAKKHTNNNAIEDKYKSPKYVDKLQYMVCWYIYLSIATLFIHLFLRFNNYFIPFAILAGADVCFSKIKIKKSIYNLSFGLWSILLFSWLFFPIYSYGNKDTQTGIIRIRRYYPYESVLNPKKNNERENLYTYYNK